MVTLPISLGVVGPEPVIFDDDRKVLDECVARIQDWGLPRVHAGGRGCCTKGFSFPIVSLTPSFHANCRATMRDTLLVGFLSWDATRKTMGTPYLTCIHRCLLNGARVAQTRRQTRLIISVSHKPIFGVGGIQHGAKSGLSWCFRC